MSQIQSHAHAIDERASLRRPLLASILSGQIAGLIMAVVVMAVFTILGKGPLFPVQVIGSFIFGEPATVGIHVPALLAGLVLHQGAALLWSLVFYAASQRVATSTVAGATVVGAIVGLASQIIDVNLVMPAAMKALHGQDLWALNVPAFWSWAAHLVFGVAFAVYPGLARRLEA